MCASAVRGAGTVTIVGVYGTPFDNFPIAQMFAKGLRVRCCQTPVHNHIDGLLRLAHGGRAEQDGCLKVVPKP